jgi:transposase
MGGHRKRTLSGEAAEWLERRLSERAFTLRGLVEELGERGVNTGLRAVWVFVHDQGLSFKKNRAGRRADTPRHRP